MAGFLVAFNKLMESRSGLIEACRMAQARLCDTRTVDARLATLRRDLDVVSALARKEIEQTAKVAGDPDCSNDHIERFQQISEQISLVYADMVKRLDKAKVLERFVREVESRTLVLAAFDESCS